MLFQRKLNFSQNNKKDEEKEMHCLMRSQNIQIFELFLKLTFSPKFNNLLQTFKIFLAPRDTDITLNFNYLIKY